MTRLEIDGDTLVLEVQGMDRMWALKSELRIPLAHVSGAAPAPDEAKEWWHGIKAPGTNIPGVITAGTFYSHGDRVFWDVHNPEHAISIQLHDDSFARLVVEVRDPATEIARIEAALPR